MELNWTEIVLGVFALIGILYQSYNSKKAKAEGENRSKETKQHIDAGKEELAKAVAENTALAKENHRLILENQESVRELTEKLGANDIATVSVVRNTLRDIYYKVRPFKMISDTDFRAVTELYNAYKAVTLPDGHHPNSWCDGLYEEMKSYQRVETYPNGMHHITTSPLPLSEEEKANN